MLTQQSCHILNTDHVDFVGYGHSPVDASDGVIRGRPRGKFYVETYDREIVKYITILDCDYNWLKACAQRFRYALFAFIHTQTYFEYYTLTLRLASLVKKAVIYAYWTKELFDICRENVSYMATLPSVARHVIHADNLRPRH